MSEEENSIEKLQDRLEELHKTQNARLACGADDLDVREEIAEVEDKIKELQDGINEENRINILKIECYITINNEKDPILNVGTSFSNIIESEEFKYYNDELHKNIKPILNDLKQMLLDTLEKEKKWKIV